MGGEKETTPKVSEEEFLTSLEEVTDMLKGKKPYTEATAAASRILDDYARMRTADVHAKRIRMSEEEKEK
jgi:hypothetical protein